MRIELTPENVTQAQVNVTYKYRANSDLLAQSQREPAKTTGFRLKWFLQSRNGSEQQLCDNCTEWKPREVSPVYSQTKERLAKMVRLSRRLDGKEEGKIRKVLNAKLSNKRFIMNFDEWCFNGQIKDKYQDEMIEEVFDELGYDDTEREERDTEKNDRSDLKTGFIMFSAIVFYPSTVLDIQLYNFLDDLISNESPRTLIYGIVNTLGSKDLDRKTSTNLNDFFNDLDSMISFEFGKILLALSSPAEIESMLQKGLPYMTKYKGDIEMSLNGTDISDVHDIVKSGRLTVQRKPENLYIFLFSCRGSSGSQPSPCPFDWK